MVSDCVMVREIHGSVQSTCTNKLTGLMRFSSPCALLCISRVSPDHFRSMSHARRTASVGLVAHVSET